MPSFSNSGEHRRRGNLRVGRLRVQPLADTFLFERPTVPGTVPRQRPRSPKTVFICVSVCVFGIGDFAVRKVYLFQLFAKSPLLVFKHFQVLHLSSSFQQNWFHEIWISIAKVIDFPVCENEFLTFPIYFYNIFLDYDFLCILMLCSL